MQIVVTLSFALVKLETQLSDRIGIKNVRVLSLRRKVK